jgi:hypothetical protein
MGYWNESSNMSSFAGRNRHNGLGVLGWAFGMVYYWLLGIGRGFQQASERALATVIYHLAEALVNYSYLICNYYSIR